MQTIAHLFEVEHVLFKVTTSDLAGFSQADDLEHISVPGRRWTCLAPYISASLTWNGHKAQSFGGIDFMSMIETRSTPAPAHPPAACPPFERHRYGIRHHLGG